jgi:hypothetical protein
VQVLTNAVDKRKEVFDLALAFCGVVGVLDQPAFDIVKPVFFASH